MKISLIVAMDKKGVIGLEGDLPWHLSADLKHFKVITMSKPLIMGRRTHESIGHPLPGRQNIVLTRGKNFKADGCTVVHSLDDALHAAGDVGEVMIMGGAGLYEQSLERANRLYLTEVHADISGDVYFPEFNKDDWIEIEREDHSADDKNDFDFSFVVMERK
ncbi:MAG: type 3 dihydrofolate reductase [Proteobacteria bacterium]|nr:type 3 dihydrofolate reductase [Pseudomonadota bacterium]